ncbi:MAG: hypothetical protein M1817_006642 [Caeruleum heppii]|nr:MAG: hypothetical protein M1817_006642 [Caeruleum heppii]
MDYSALRAQTLSSTADEEAVTVNTRALIDKVLARYSGEWTVLRELLQNASDASATNVSIRFETIPSTTVPAPISGDISSSLRHVLQHHTLKRLVVTNNGQPFAVSDWARLKRIAEGNPDETKIGAFGVGFYSVFADCEEPFVSSGKEAMAFYWKGNSLFTRRTTLPEQSASRDTTFVLDYRSEGSPVPSLMPLCQFLATSLTFVGLEVIDLWLDEWRLIGLTKKASPSVDLPISRDIQTKTAEGLMKVASVQRQTVQMDATWMNVVSWKARPAHRLAKAISNSSVPDFNNMTNAGSSLRGFFSRLARGPVENHAKEDDPQLPVTSDDLGQTSTVSVFMRTTTAEIRTSVSASFAQELERATKKPPPKTTQLALLTASYEQEAGLSSGPRDDKTSGQGEAVFATVLPNKNGRIFIGFPTHQTTSVLAHISAQSVIPTVERESIDLNARYVRTWNMELLRAAGILCRVAWSDEMAEVGHRLSRMAMRNEHKNIGQTEILTVLPEAIHVLREFTFKHTTPSTLVGDLIEEAFWTSNRRASIEMFSTHGILPSHDVRIATEDLSSFVQGIPILPQPLMDAAPEFVSKIKEYGLVTEITIADVKKQLEAKILDDNQLPEFLKWAARKSFNREVPISTIQSLLDVAVATGSNGTVLALVEIKLFVNVSKISVEMPLPPNTIPFEYTKHLTKAELESLGWEELQIVPWLRYLVESANRALPAEKSLDQSPAFAAQVLPILSKQWDSLSQSSKASIVTLLQARTIIPTRLGMRKPSEAYFASVKLFEDLPIVNGLHGVKDKVLLALGVRKTVELSVVFERLLSENNDAKGQWSHVDLIRYLASVRDDIPTDEIKRLRNTAICPVEAVGRSDKPASTRYKVMDLFEPKDALRELQFPTLQWPGIYRAGSSEGKFLTSLGLKPHPSVPELFDIMASAPAQGQLKLRDRALTFYVVNYHNNGYDRFVSSGLSLQQFLPVESESSTALKATSECFTNERATALGFAILRRDLHPHALKFGVKRDPPISVCIQRMVNDPPRYRSDAVVVFGYLASRLAEIPQATAEQLASRMFIPVSPKAETSGRSGTPKNGVVPRFASPETCFLGDNADYKDIFDFVDFGSEANAFLLKCGSRDEPTKTQLASMLVQDPARILGALQSTDKYLNFLRNIADSLPSLKKDKALYKEMKRAPFLLAYKEILGSSTNSKPETVKRTEELDDDFDLDEDAGIKEWALASAEEIVLIDDFISYNLFRENLLVAPQEETLEAFYHTLGSPLLSTKVEETSRIGSVVADQRMAVKLRKLVLERSRLFLHDNTADAVHHDVRWLEDNLDVQAVHSISLRRSLRGRNLTLTEKRTAAVTQQTKGWSLWVTAGGYDMFQVSQALVGVLLKRPKPHSTMMFEMLLSTDLLKLRSRGYNVDRILRSKAAEARVAEDRRQKQLQEEETYIKRQEQAWKDKRESRQHEHPSTPEQPQLPGSFVESPEQKQVARAEHDEAAETQVARKTRGLFTSLTKRFGLDEGGKSVEPIKGPQAGQQPGPPPGQQIVKKGKDVVPPHMLQQKLLGAIGASRAHDSSTLFSRPQTNHIAEVSSYCDEKPGHDISFLADTAPGIKVFVSNMIPDKSAFLQTNAGNLNLFAALLVDCAQVFALPQGTLHIFHDEQGTSIAFNRQGSLFCNFHFFAQLHGAGVRTGRADARSEAMVYWWVVLCHELAHNLVADHSAEHSYWTENFVSHYFPTTMMKVAEYGRSQGGVSQVK